MAFELRLGRLELTNFRKFARYTIDFDEDVTVLVGANGSGKSSVLAAARAALGSFASTVQPRQMCRIDTSDSRVCRYEMGGVTDWQGQYPVVISAEGRAGENPGDTISWSLSLDSADDGYHASRLNKMQSLALDCLKRVQSGDAGLVLPLVAHYGTRRLWAKSGASHDRSRTSFSRQDGYTGSLDAVADERQMLDWFYKMTAQDVQRAQSLRPMGESPLFATVRRAVEHCFEGVMGCKRASVTYNLDVDDLDIEYLDVRDEMQRIHMSLLSDGYRTTLSMFADMAYRMAILNPALGEHALEAPGVVLIDEVDLHLHPLWQARILGDLRSTFPNVQFIVTTHAPMVISSVPGRQIRILGDDGAYAPDHEVFGMGASDVLTGIMGSSSRQPEVDVHLHAFAKLLDERDFDAAENELDRLEELTGPDNPDLVAARSALFFERL